MEKYSDISTASYKRDEINDIQGWTSSHVNGVNGMPFVLSADKFEIY